MNTSFMPTLRQLRAFVAVYQLGKLSAAAEQLFVTQSAISVLIRQMEQALGVRLFDRTTRSLQPTQAAREALVVAERILRDVESLGSSFRDLSGLRRGRVCVAVTPTLAVFMMPPVIRRFAALHPEIRVVVDDCAPDQFMSRVIGEHVDFGIGTPEKMLADADIRTLVHDQLSLVCRPDHVLAGQRVVRWADLAGHPVITVRPGYGIRPMIDATAAGAGVSLNVVNEVSFLSTALWMTASGMGASIMPSAFAIHGAEPGMVIKTLSQPRVSRDISVVTKRGRSLSAAASSFVEVMVAVLGKAGARAQAK
ncbi:LysR family transcriptional regulator [Polaromonas eurypsychrophila]|uniref:LysR family transcriptional regulator n=1 Tax=Polaromonas eurypsychrophila TaxID=1614635 RepID=A0A916WDZ9_9BURK|nr:LysR family transcriptional regulator [Polaromonas eurypsychrophila]GGA90811.1 LysR family transcriptional regulator [Polaromonas eurypsychrophila]